MAVELSARATIRTDNVEAAHQAMVNAAQTLGHKLQDRSATQISRGRRNGPDFLYLMSGGGPLDGAYLRLYQPRGASFYRLQVSQEVTLHEDQLGEAQAGLTGFLSTIELAVNGAVGTSEPTAAPVPARDAHAVAEAGLDRS